MNARRAGRRLSVARLSISLIVATVILGAGVAAASAPFLSTPESTSSRWFGGYYDATLESGVKLTNDSIAEAPGTAVLSFVVAADEDDCTPTWGAAYGLDDAARLFELDRRIARIRDRGGQVAVSFGGAINTELADACTSVRDLRAAYRTVIDRYRVDIMDLDVEGPALRDVAGGERRARAVAQLQEDLREDDRDLQVWITLPVMPDGLTSDGVRAVDQLLAAGVELAGVNVMTMNYGIDLGERTMADAAADALTATGAQLDELLRAHQLPPPDGGTWGMLGATPMIGRNDVSGEVFTLDDARALAELAQERGLARLSMWSLNRDRTCGSNYADPAVVSAECSGVEQAGESYAHVLASSVPPAPDPAPTTPNAPARTDDPATSPYPVWTSTTFYSAGVKVVWHGGVYVSKWWNENGPAPDDPTISAAASPWVYIGPVLEDDEPFALPTLPDGTYPEWSADATYQQGDRVQRDGTGYEARWWSRGAAPERSILDRDYSPWMPLAP